jgi:nucleoside-diphosphate-sugar epimerase
VRGGAPRLVAVTGAAGFVGQALCRTFAQRGLRVRALVRGPGAVDLGPGVARARCVLPDGIDPAALAGVDVLVHAAWATRETDPERAQRVNEDGTRRLLEGARGAGVPSCVFISSIAARADAPSHYGRSKFAAERLFDGPGDLVVRPGLVLGAGGRGLFQQLLGAAERLHVVPLFAGGRQPLQTVHVDDLCAAVAAALERGIIGAVAVAEPEPIAMRDFLRAMVRLRRIRCLFVPLPFGPMLAALRTAERVGVTLPLRSESLLGLAGMQRVAVEADLARLGVVVRPALESLTALLTPGRAP